MNTLSFCGKTKVYRDASSGQMNTNSSTAPSSKYRHSSVPHHVGVKQVIGYGTWGLGVHDGC